MNLEKARELYSPYYEDTLEPGLKQALEQAMRRDGALREDFRQFESAYEELGALKFETIEVPFDLQDRILARIDLHEHEARRTASPSWVAWVRNVALGGVGLAAVVGALFSLQNFRGETSGAALLNPASLQEVVVGMQAGQPVVQYAPARAETVVIRDGLRGPERQRFTLDRQPLESPLRNSRPNAAVFSIEVEGRNHRTLVALPGTQRGAEREGSGNVEDLARALADFYRLPVVVRVMTPEAPVVWRFDVANPVDAATTALDTQRYSIERTASGMLKISDQ